MSQTTKRTVFTKHERIGGLIVLSQFIVVPATYYFVGSILLEWLTK